jgi:hypothetical protein
VAQFALLAGINKKKKKEKSKFVQLAGLNIKKEKDVSNVA